jgi:hypothetical protein
MADREDPLLIQIAHLAPWLCDAAARSLIAKRQHSSLSYGAILRIILICNMTPPPERDGVFLQECRVPPYVAETPLAGLKTAEVFLLTTLRLWLAAHRRAQAPDWRRGLAAAGLMEDGAPDFDMTLRILVAGVRQLDSRAACHPRLSADEARLLRLFGALQRGEIGVDILEAWLPSKPLRWLLQYARSFLSVMAAQKLILPDRMPEAGPHCALRANLRAFQDRGYILLH